MNAHILQWREERRTKFKMSFKASKPDARILILQIAVAGVLGFYFHNEVAVIGLFLVIDFLLLYWYGLKVFLKRLISYAVMYGLIFVLTAVNVPILSMVFPAFLMMILRAYPVYLLLKLLVDKAPIDELLYALDAIHIPKSLSIPLMVVYRYVPTILRESHYINESLKMRDLNLSFSNLTRLVKTLENYMVPLLFRSEKISEELSATSLCKGLSLKRKRTCCTDVRFTRIDFLYLLGMAAVICGLFTLNYSNF